MSKKNTNTVTETATATDVTSLDAKLAALRAEIANIAKQREEAAEAEKTALYDKITELPKMFGKENVGEVYKLIGQYVRANRDGKAGAGRSRIPDETKDKIRKMLKGEILTPENTKYQVTQIAAETDVSVPTVMKLKSELGLVNHRTPTATTEATA